MTTLGMLCGSGHLGAGAPREVVWGAAVAVGAVTDALLRHGSYARYELFTGPGDVDTTRAHVAAILNARKSQAKSTPPDVRVHPVLDAVHRGRTLPVDVWHDPNPSHKPFHVRRAAARAPHPITLSHHTVSYGDQLHTLFLPLLLAGARPYDSLVCTSTAAARAIDVLFAHLGEALARDHGLRLRWPGRLDVIPLGVDTDLFRPAADRAALRATLKLPERAFILLWLGRLAPHCKADLLPLLRVLAALRRDNWLRDVVLVVAGTPVAEYDRVLRAWAGTLGLGAALHVVTSCPPAERHHLFAAADIFVSPVDHVQETFGLTPVEAMACGVPQVVSDWDGYRDTVADGETGFRVPTWWAPCDDDLVTAAPLVPPAYREAALGQSVAVDLEGMRDRIQALIRNDALRARMGEASRRRAVERFDWRVVVAAYEALWHELAGIARRAPAEPPAASPPPPGWMDTPIHAAFAHYATAMLGDDARLCVTPDGTRLMQQVDPPPPIVHAIPGRPIDAALLVTVLRTVNDRHREGGTFGDVVATLVDAGCASASVARRHVLWLLKYGLVQRLGAS